jgi:hypothetical protein
MSERISGKASIYPLLDWTDGTAEGVDVEVDFEGAYTSGDHGEIYEILWVRRDQSDEDIRVQVEAIVAAWGDGNPHPLFDATFFERVDCCLEAHLYEHAHEYADDPEFHLT